MSETFESIDKEEQTLRDIYVASQAPILYWAYNEFKWTPKAFYQELLLGCFDRVYRFPENYSVESLQGKVVRKFAWRIGRQSGKSESLAIGALYLGICKPVTAYTRVRSSMTPGAIWVDPDKDTYDDAADDKKNSAPKRPGYWGVPYKRGANIIVASADADKVKTNFDRVMKFLNGSAKYQLAMEEGVINIKKHPFPTIIINVEGWKHPAEIVFRGPGAKGQALRSKTFDYKLYDEADYFPAAFFEAEKATEINAGTNAFVVVSSTPTGRRDHFYKCCFGLNTPVLTDEGLKPIQDILIGDMVYNRFGVLEPVTDVINRPFKQKIAHLKIYAFNKSIVVTPNHRFMVVRKLDRFCESCQTMVWGKKTKCKLYGNHKDLPEAEPKYVAVSDLYEGDYVAFPKNVYEIVKKENELNESQNQVHGNFVYVPITNIDLEDYDAEVYNLTVGEDHSYNVCGFGVSNCTNPKYGYKEFHFPSWENPEYTAEMDEGFQLELNQTGYDHEIMAEWGTVEEGVFDWTYFQRVFGYKYNMNSKAGQVNYSCIRLAEKDVRAIGMENLASKLVRKFPPKNPMARYWFGADLGYSADPSEFVIFEEFNGVMKLVLRIHMEHLTYDIQADMIALLDTYYMFKRLGMDAGNNGTSVAQILMSKRQGWQKFAHHNFEKRLMPIPFGGSLLIGRTNGKEVKLPAKMAMTNMIIHAAEQKLLIMPGIKYDPDIENQFRNHTYSMGESGQIIYSKSSIYGDHVIDAVRTAMYVRGTEQFATVGRSLPRGGIGRTSRW